MGRVLQVHTDTYRQSLRPPNGFQQNARELATVQQHIVRPLQRERLRSACNRDQRIIERQRGHERPQREQLRRTDWAQDQSGGKVAFGVGPCPAPSATCCRLLMRHDPERALIHIGTARRFGVGAVHGIEDDYSVSLGPIAHVCSFRNSGVFQSNTTRPLGRVVFDFQFYVPITATGLLRRLLRCLRSRTGSQHRRP